jgi:hypothetical protein
MWRRSFKARNAEAGNDEYAEYSDDPELEVERRKSLPSSIIKFGALSIAAVLGTTFASNININSGGSSEFGQGVTLTTSCSGSESISIKPSSSFNNTSNKFEINKITLSNIPANCENKDFLLSLYSDISVVSLDTGVDTARIIYKGSQTTLIYSGISGTNTFGATISAAAVTGGYGSFAIDFSGSRPLAENVKKITLQSVGAGITAGGNGTLGSPGVSAYQIHNDYPSLPDGLYWITNPNINGGSPVKIYADMTRNGGGWTLIVANASTNGWDNATTLLTNETNPPADPTYAGAIGNISSRYSILSWADYIKKDASGFQYRMEANTYGKWGGIWTANQPYSFVSQSESNMDITLNERFNPTEWTYPVDNGIEARMPFYQPGQCYVLSTTNDNWWWGTIVSTCGWTPAPWIEGTGGQDPGIIWYWVR